VSSAQSAHFRHGQQARLALTLAPVKTLDGQAVSGLRALSFIRKLRNYQEGFGF
jgi:hypothetical protein